MKLRKKKTPEELRRRKGVSDYVHKVGRGFKQLGTEMLTPASKAGGALISAYKGEPLDITSEDLTLAVLSGIAGGKPGGLPAGAVGTGMTRDAALKALGKSAATMTNRYGSLKKARRASKILRKHDSDLPKDLRVAMIKRSQRAVEPFKVKQIAASIRKSPKEILDPLTEVKYSKELGPSLGQNERLAGRQSRVDLAPKATPDVFFHEAGAHGFSHGVRGKRNLTGYRADMLETASKIGKKRAATANKLASTNRSFYEDMPIESHARAVAEKMTDLEKAGPISGAVHRKVFTEEAKAVLGDLKKKASTIHKKAMKDVAKSYRKEAAFKRYVKEGIQEGRAPGTFNEWYEGLLTNPKSKSIKPVKTTKPKKKLTPGEMARMLQEIAEAKTPAYLRRMAD